MSTDVLIPDSSDSNIEIFVENAQEDVSLAPAEAPVPRRRCKPFSLSVMVFSPEAGYKFEIETERNCSASNEELWRLVFILQKMIDGKFVTLVEVKYDPREAREAEEAAIADRGLIEENKGIAVIAGRGLTRTQIRTARNDVFPKTKPLADEGRNPTPEESEAIRDSMRKLVVVR